MNGSIGALIHTSQVYIFGIVICDMSVSECNGYCYLMGQNVQRIVDINDCIMPLALLNSSSYGISISQMSGQ